MLRRLAIILAALIFGLSSSIGALGQTSNAPKSGAVVAQQTKAPVKKTVKKKPVKPEKKPIKKTK